MPDIYKEFLFLSGYCSNVYNVCGFFTSKMFHSQCHSDTLLFADMLLAGN